MPRFFFDIQGEDTVTDQRGVELADRESARMHAVDLASEHLQGQSLDGARVKISIRDLSGEVLDTVSSVGWRE